jgi:hypothetical protein
MPAGIITGLTKIPTNTAKDREREGHDFSRAKKYGL